MKKLDVNTQQKIKEAAKQLFYQKGYAATRTREIAEVAEVNIALLNYYFRSKEKLFDEIMVDSVREVFNTITQIVNNRESTLMKKVEIIVSKYTDTLTRNPQLLLFVLSELRQNKNIFFKKVEIPQLDIVQSYLFEQIQNQIDAKKLTFTPLDIFLNIISLSVMPIATKNLIEYTTNLPEEQIDSIIQQRKTLIPFWIKSILQIDN